jgi:hypothetical protein
VTKSYWRVDAGSNRHYSAGFNLFPEITAVWLKDRATPRERGRERERERERERDLLKLFDAFSKFLPVQKRQT